MDSYIMNKAKFNVLYDGTALENSEMDVNDLAPALLALGSLLEEINHVINKDKAKVAVNVKASFKTGCFGIELDTIVSLLQQAHSLFSDQKVATAKELLEWAGLIVGTATTSVVSLLTFIKWVKGRKISKVEILNDGTCKVYIDKDHIVVENNIIELYRERKVREAFYKVLSPLEKEGIDEFAITDLSQKNKFTVITKHEATYFSPPPVEDINLDDDEMEMNLQLVNIAFQDANKWRFSDGNATFYADVLDSDFLNKVQFSEISFSKGDILKAKVRRVQYLRNNDMKTEYQIIKIIDHKKGLSQLSMPFVD